MEMLILIIIAGLLGLGAELETIRREVKQILEEIRDEIRDASILK